VKEKDPMAIKYKNKSVAESHSCDLALDILNEPALRELRACIYTNEEELTRFRSIVVNLVLATDIIDAELGALRKDRWARAFSQVESAATSTDDDRANSSNANRKATIVLEHLIQASDIAHTMQHWHIYRKWVRLAQSE
jgi:3'5'-cyclic nucleotide phosphodiesterase